MRALIFYISMASIGFAALQPLYAQGRMAGRSPKAARPLTSVELLLKLYHSSPAAAAVAIKQRGTGFDVTPALEKLLVEAGADKSLLAMAALRRVEDAPAGAPVSSASPSAASAIRMDPGVQARKLLQRAEAAHPPGARQLTGKVTIEVLVGTDGKVKNARVISGEPPFTSPALEAAQKYVYRPTVLDGEAVEVITDVTIQFESAATPAAATTAGQQ